MKKLVFLLIGLLFFYISFAQIEKSASPHQMSDYEKYALSKEGGISDTIFIEQEKREWDDLYYTHSKDELKRKAKDLRLRKKEIKMEQDSLYYDAKKEVYDNLSFTAQIYRFHRPFYGFGYYTYYWDPFYDPWFLDPWGYGGYPYYHSYWGFGYNYHSWYGWGYPYYFSHNHYNNYYGLNHNNYIQYGRREKPSNLSSTYTIIRRQPTSVNRPIQIDRTSRRVSAPQENRVSAINTSRINNNWQRINPAQGRRVERSTYSSPSKSYAPRYTQPRMGTRPQYNNTNINRNYTAPRPSSNRSSTYSAPSRSYNSGSSFSGGSRNSGSSYSGRSNRSSSGSTRIR
jgi:hypothetical protein